MISRTGDVSSEEIQFTLEDMRRAIDADDVNVISRYLKSNQVSSLNQLFLCDGVNETLLTYAVSKGRVNIVRLLLQHDSIDLNVMNSLYHTPLKVALRKDSIEMFDLIVLKMSQNDIDLNDILTPDYIDHIVDLKPLSILSHAIELNYFTQEIMFNLLKCIVDELDNYINKKSETYKRLFGLRTSILESEKFNFLRDGRKLLMLAMDNRLEGVALELLYHAAIDTSVLPSGQSLLSKAHQYGMFHLLESFLDKKIPIDRSDSRESTILMWAAFKGNHQYIDKIRTSYPNVDVNQRDKHNMTALHYAVDNQHVEAVKALLAFGNIAFIENMKNDTPLDIAIKLHNPEITSLLQAHQQMQFSAVSLPSHLSTLKYQLQSPASGYFSYIRYADLKLNSTPGLSINAELAKNIYANRISVIRTFLEVSHSQTINDLFSYSNYQESLLNYAILSSKYDIVNMLLNDPAINLTLANSLGVTPLEVALRHNDTTMFELVYHKMCERHLDPAELFRSHPFHYFLSSRSYASLSRVINLNYFPKDVLFDLYKSIIEALELQDEDLSDSRTILLRLRDLVLNNPVFDFKNCGRQHLLRAINENADGAAVELMMHGDIDLAVTEEGISLATLAYEYGMGETLDVLLERHVELDSPNSKKMTLLMRAAAYGDDALINQIFVINPNMVNQVDAYGNSALYFAVVNQQTSVVAALLRLDNIDITLVNADNKSLIQVAMESKNDGIIELFNAYAKKYQLGFQMKSRLLGLAAMRPDVASAASAALPSAGGIFAVPPIANKGPATTISAPVQSNLAATQAPADAIPQYVPVHREIAPVEMLGELTLRDCAIHFAWRAAREENIRNSAANHQSAANRRRIN